MFKPISAIFVLSLGVSLVLLTNSTGAADEIEEQIAELKQAEYTILAPLPPGTDGRQYAVGLGESEALSEARDRAIQNAKAQLISMFLTKFQIVNIKATEEKGKYLVQVLMALPLAEKLGEALSDKETNLDQATEEVLKLEAALDSNGVREIKILKPPPDTDGLLYTVGLGESESLVRAKQLATQDAKAELADVYLLGVSVAKTVIRKHNGLYTVEVMVEKPIKDNSLETSPGISRVTSEDEELYQRWRAAEGLRRLEKKVEEQKKAREQAPEEQQKPENKE